MLVKDIVYMILDLAKAATSDDSFFTEEHVIFLIKKYRAFLIKKEQEKEKSTTDTASEFEYQQICLDLQKVDALDGFPCEEGYYLRTTEPIPKLLEGTQPTIYPADYFSDVRFTFVPRERMRFVGTNKYLRNIIWASLGPDLHLYMKSNNSQFLYLEGENKLKMMAIFEDFDEAVGLLCDNGDEDGTPCDVLDATFPIREYLVPTLIELVVKELVGAEYKVTDEINNAKDDIQGLAVRS